MSSELPFVDAHEIVLPVPIEAAWDRLEQFVARSAMLDASGFPERETVKPTRLRLTGSHPFSVYELCFDLEPTSEHGDETRVRATTHAKFKPGLGSVYRALVIGSGAHAFVVRRLLRRL